MRRVLRLLFGLRRDLDLSKRWWHRLCLVLFVLVIGAAFLFLAGAVAENGPPLLPSNVRVIDNLQSYTRAHPELVNTVSSFRALGSTGKLLPDGGVQTFFWDWEDEAFCTANPSAHLEEAREFRLRRNATAGRSEGLTTEDVAKALRDEAARGINRVCFINPSFGLPTSSLIVAYEVRPLARLVAWAKALSLGALVAMGLALILTNVYYRGLIYVIFGREHSR